ncbi:MAG: response regulator transcription factor [Jiangellaceae bacterium]|nr:response regulator transcription factor [Jiangellaceae bacterium]
MDRRLLLIEDDARLRSALTLVLSDEGWVVDEAVDGEQGLRLLAEPGRYDVVLLDLRLPGIDGFEVCRRIRRTNDVPIVMVTARQDSHDVVAGLEAGADDYVTKPLSAKVLVARLRALLRRTGSRDGAEPKPIVDDDLEIRLDSAMVVRNGHPVSLTRTELKLLAELANARGRVLSREELLERVWGYDYFGDSRLVDVHIRRLRAKIEAEPAAPRHVITVRGMGYRFGP